MSEAATLPLGAQMAIVFVGINIFIPLLASGILSFIIVISVRMFRGMKGILGQSGSKSLVRKFKDATSIGNSSTDDRPTFRAKLSSIEEDEIDDAPAKWANIRKRRPSVVNNVAAEDSAESSSSVVSSLSGRSESPNTRDRTSSASSSRSSRVGSAMRRLLSSSSVNSRVHPSSPAFDASKKEPDSWAWVEGDTMDRNKENATQIRKSRELKRKYSDRVLSPSQCYVEGLGTETYSVTTNDMQAFDVM